jgi:hypothetical protein
MSERSKQLIVFAWAIESVGVVGGMLNSAYTTFGNELPSTLSGWIPAIPMVAVSVAEFGRVPLASVVYHRHKLIQGVAILGILALGYLAVENWSFGFERIVDLRLKPVNAASRELAVAEDQLSALKNQRHEGKTSNSQKRDELRRGIEQRDASIAELTDQLNKEADAHRGNLEQIRDACRLIREKCMVPRSQAEDLRYQGAVNELNAELGRVREDRKNLQAQIDALVMTDANDGAAIDPKIAAAEAVVTEKREALRHAYDGNQIYRLAASWYGVSTFAVTEEQFATARWVFATFSAIAVALAGSVAALVYYASTRAPGAPSAFGILMTKVFRARRAYYARSRRRVVREVPGPERVVYRDGKEPPIVVEKEVVRPIDQIVLIPRFGIRFSIHINSFLRRGNRNTTDRLTRDSTEPSNVMPLVKKAN